MPGPAIHLLVLADLEAQLQAAGGATASRMRRALSAHPAHAALGAIGPDLFYLAGSRGLALAERLLRLLSEAARPFAALHAGRRRRERAGLGEEAAAFTHAAMARLEAHLATDLEERVLAAGHDLLAHLRPALQDGQPEAEWSWGDLLHYRRPGRFAAALLEQALAGDRDDLLAYAAGYVSHVATDACGHAFVNTIVGGPYRLHYHRHHLVEMHMDAWAWQARHGLGVESAGLDARIDLGPTLPEPLLDLLTRARTAVYGGEPQPAATPDLGAAYAALRRLLAARSGGLWRRLPPPEERGLAVLLWQQAQERHEQVRAALAEIGLVYPPAAAVDLALCCAPAGPPDPEYPRASIHVPGRRNLASPRSYPPTPRDGLRALLAADGTPYPGPPWRPSLYAGQAPDACMAAAARTAAAYCLGAAIPDLNLDADPVEGVGCWRVLGDLRGARYRLQEI